MRKYGYETSAPKLRWGICEALGVNWLARVQIDKINGDGGCAYVNNKTVIFPCRVARFHSAKVRPPITTAVTLKSALRQNQTADGAVRMFAPSLRHQVSRKHALNVRKPDPAVMERPVPYGSSLPGYQRGFCPCKVWQADLAIYIVFCGFEFYADIGITQQASAGKGYNLPGHLDGLPSSIVSRRCRKAI